MDINGIQLIVIFFIKKLDDICNQYFKNIFNSEFIFLAASQIISIENKLAQLV